MDPTVFRSPILLTGPGDFVLEADNADIIQHFADARFMGYEWEAGRVGTNLNIDESYMR